MKEHKDSGFLHGLLLGIIVGVVVTLMFTTKKGRQIFNTLTSEGLGELEDIKRRLDSVKDKVEDDLIIEEDAEEDSAKLDDSKKFIASTKPSNGVKKPHLARRLFKGIPRKQ